MRHNKVTWAIQNKGYHARREGKERFMGARIYRRAYFLQFWEAGWDEAENEIVAANFADKRNQFSLMSPRNPFFGKPVRIS
jgi:hypothetical protein